jgi:hypothetical protein
VDSREGFAYYDDSQDKRGQVGDFPYDGQETVHDEFRRAKENGQGR